MKKKDKIKKKKYAVQMLGNREIQVETQDLIHRIEYLEKELKQREGTIDTLNRKLRESKARKKKKSKSPESALSALFAQQKTRVGVDQKRAWKRHGYLRDRYEFHLSTGQSIADARTFAGQDLRMVFGDDAGYSEQELEHILS